MLHHPEQPTASKHFPFNEISFPNAEWTETIKSEKIKVFIIVSVQVSSPEKASSQGFPASDLNLASATLPVGRNCVKLFFFPLKNLHFPYPTSNCSSAHQEGSIK